MHRSQYIQMNRCSPAPQKVGSHLSSAQRLKRYLKKEKKSAVIFQTYDLSSKVYLVQNLNMVHRSF